MPISRRHFISGVLAGGLVFQGSGAVALNEDDARAHIGTTLEELKAMLKVPGSATSRATELRRIMATRGNMPLIAKFSAGRVWREMDEGQQSRFVDAFEHYVSITYSKRFDEYSGEPNISVGRSIDVGRKGILVQTPIVVPNGPPIAVEWLVSDRGGRTEIVDLVIEGISMAATQRAEIGAMLEKRNGDVDVLIKDLAAAS